MAQNLPITREQALEYYSSHLPPEPSLAGAGEEIGVNKSNSVLMASSDMSGGEWIRMEVDGFLFGEFRVEP